MNDAQEKPRRRWFRFGLWTMFVVLTVFSLWLGWQAKIVRERREALTTFRERGRKIVTSEAALGLPIRHPEKIPTIPFWRRWMGDEAVFVISTQRDAVTDELAIRYFPEAACCDDNKPVFSNVIQP